MQDFVSSSLDPDFQPAILFARHYETLVSQAKRRLKLQLALEREDQLVSSYKLEILPFPGPQQELSFRYVERHIKSMLWAYGGWRLYLSGCDALAARLQVLYSPSGARAFDSDFVQQVYEQPLSFMTCSVGQLPAGRHNSQKIGGHLSGCRLGFDLGASDYKVAAVAGSQVLFSAEFSWQPQFQTDPQYHYQHLNDALRTAAKALPQVQVIGGSAAGVYIDNRVRVASIFRGVPRERFAETVAPFFLRLAQEWQTPLKVINDGAVAALAGALTLQRQAVLGIAMGSSEAAGCLDAGGGISSRLDELAFVPVDLNPAAPIDEWSGDRGSGVSYFSQQGALRLAVRTGMALPAAPPAEQLLYLQELCQQGNPQAAAVFKTIGVYLGYTIPWYLRFYHFSDLLLLGRVLSGPGGSLIREQATTILQENFPQEAEQLRLHLPDENTKRVGQAVAAASLLKLP